nr:transposase [Pararhizobium sp. IMCC3301]
MLWTDITRAEQNRSSNRYPSDLTDAERAIVRPFVPPARPGSRRRTTDMRVVLNAIMYTAGGGIAWRMLPKDVPPVSTVGGYFYRWRNDGTLSVLNFALVQMAREFDGKEPCPGAGVIDSQSGKTTEDTKPGSPLLEHITTVSTLPPEPDGKACACALINVCIKFSQRQRPGYLLSLYGRKKATGSIINRLCGRAAE